jgi:hypothetical protein
MQIHFDRQTLAPAIDPLALHALRATLQGQLITPEDEGYVAARTPWHLHLVQYPAMIVMAIDAADVVAAVSFAAAQGMPVGVQATGHGAAVPCDGGVLINTSAMRAVTIDPQARTARVAAGAQWGAVLAAAQEHGLAPLLGSSPNVGVVGYTLGGGIGWLTRKYGLAVDSVRSFEIVTADGYLRRVDAQNDPDLFWGVRGSAGNFGVITSVEIELFPVSTVYAGNIFFPIEMAREVLQAYRSWITTLSEDWTTSVVIMHMPPAPFIPEPLRGRSVVIVRGCNSGDLAAAEAELQPIRDLGGIIIDAFGPLPFANAAAISQDPVDPMNTMGRTETLADLSDETIDALITVAGRPPVSPVVLAEVRHLGGAMRRAPAQPSAFSHRDMEFVLNIIAMPHSPDHESVVASYLAASVAVLEPQRTGQTYMNFLSDIDGSPERVRAAFTPAAYARLVVLKQRYDPRNMFRFNRNIPPAVDRRSR